MLMELKKQGVAVSRINDQTVYPKNAMLPGSKLASDAWAILLTVCEDWLERVSVRSSREEE